MAKKKTKDRDAVRKSSLCFSLSEKEKREIFEAADARGLTVSSYIRYKVLYVQKELR